MRTEWPAVYIAPRTLLKSWTTSLVREKRLPTEFRIVMFAGVHCLPEMKVWPLIFRADKLHCKLQQWKICPRYGHEHSNRKSSTTCGICGADNSEKIVLLLKHIVACVKTLTMQTAKHAQLGLARQKLCSQRMLVVDLGL